MKDYKIIDALLLPTCRGIHRRNALAPWCDAHDSPMGNRAQCVWMRSMLQAARVGAVLARDAIADELLNLFEPEEWPSRYTAEVVATVQEWRP